MFTFDSFTKGAMNHDDAGANPHHSRRFLPA